MFAACNNKITVTNFFKYIWKCLNEHYLTLSYFKKGETLIPFYYQFMLFIKIYQYYGNIFCCFYPILNMQYCTGTDMQIYSVRITRDRGPDYRGFVLVSNNKIELGYFLYKSPLSTPLKNVFYWCLSKVSNDPPCKCPIHNGTLRTFIW